MFSSIVWWTHHLNLPMAMHSYTKKTPTGVDITQLHTASNFTCGRSYDKIQSCSDAYAYSVFSLWFPCLHSARKVLS
uniref:Uncharacterized protein n=1 Tax=mine drainage metagenome TaxID=410659 RepID=E6QLB2_9ZZZZ